MIADSSLFIVSIRFDRYLFLCLSWKFLTSKQLSHAHKFPLCADSGPFPPTPSSSPMKRNITYAPIPLACSRHPIGKMELRWEGGLGRVVRSLPDPFQISLVLPLLRYYSAVYQSTLFYWLNACVKNLWRFYRAFYMNNLYLTYNGKRTEWSSIGSVTIRVIDKIVVVRFVCTSWVW